MGGTGRARRWGRWLARGALALAAALAALAVGTPLGRYVLRAAWEEGRILARRRPIAELLAAPGGVTAAERARLRLVVAARAFAGEALGLSVGGAFTSYARLDRDTLVLVLSAARRDTLAAHTWWFPVVGRFPYKGFFDPGDARAARRALEAQGFDTDLRPASAFSTLGWFDDPLLSTTLRLPPGALVNTVLHEATHGTLFVRDAVAFNESFASFVGARGAAAFFRARGDERAARAAEAAWRDARLLGSFWGAVLDAVDSAYARHPADSAARVAARDTVVARMREVLRRDVAPRLAVTDARAVQRAGFGNAALLARRTYAQEPWLFDAVHARAGASLPATVRLVARLARARPDAPFAAVRDWLARAPAPGPPVAALP